MNKKLLFHAFNIEKKDGKYYLPYSHWIYVAEIIKYFDEIVILSGCKNLSLNEESQNILLPEYSNVTVFELPTSSGTYISSLRFFRHYLKAYKKIKGVTTYYSRYPTPFGWLQKIYASKESRRIVHYVGDPIDAAINNPNFSDLKKKILISGFSVEDKMYSWACKGAAVFTNGHHLYEKLEKKSILATPLISSTLTESDFFFKDKGISPDNVKFIYLGYLRTAKGVETVLRAFSIYNKKHPESTLDIIGSGEFEQQLITIVENEDIKNVEFLGRIEDRTVINDYLRSADVFLFASLSEGSPRVILEAMANGLAVISTPVGSLPSFFTNKEEILFSDFNDPNSFFENMEKLTLNKELYRSIRQAAYTKVSDLTIERFMRKIFVEESQLES